MSLTVARNTIGLLWAACAGVAAVLPIWLHFRDWIGDDSLWLLLSQLNRSYAPYLGAVVAFYFTQTRRKKPKAVAKTAFLTALAGTIAWNAVNLYFLALLFFARMQVNTAASNLDRYSSMLAWVAAPAMGYFFGAHVSKTGESEAPSKAAAGGELP